MMCKKNESGAILVVVLWVVILLTVLLTGFLSVSRLERQFTNEIIDRIETRSAAEAVLAYLSAIYPLDNNEWSNILGRNLYLPMPNKINFKVIPEDSFISLNGASRSTLDKFFLKFIPDEISSEEWANYSHEQQMANYIYTPYRFDTDEVVSYNKATGSGTTISFRNGTKITIRDEIELLDKIFIPKELE